MSGRASIPSMKSSEGQAESPEVSSSSVRGRQMNNQAETLRKSMEKPLPVIQEPAGAEDGSRRAGSFPASGDK